MLAARALLALVLVSGAAACAMAQQSDQGEGSGDGGARGGTTEELPDDPGGSSRRTTPPSGGDTPVDTDAGALKPPPKDGGATTTSACAADGGSQGVDVVLTATGQVVEKAVSYAGAPVMPVWNAVSACPIQSDLTANARPYRAFVVQNSTANDAVLSAWAVCDAKGDAFLAFYRGTTMPTSETDRRYCATGSVLSNGNSFSVGNLNSPDSNGSQYCPALLKTQDVGITLKPCEKVIVYVQPYADPVTGTSTAPSALKLRLD